MSEDGPQVRWAGKDLRMMQQGKWEYADRCNAVHAVVILAEYDGQVVLVEQERVPLGRRCLELPAGLVGDEDDKGIEDTALKELREETGFTATRIERLGIFYPSPGMVTESFTLVRAHGLTRVGAGGGTSDEEIEVRLVPRHDIPQLIESRRAAGVGIDVKLLLFLGALLDQS